MKARYQNCLLNWELGSSSRAMAIPVLLPSSFKICGEEWFWRTSIFSMRNWGLVKAFLRTDILKCWFCGGFGVLCVCVEGGLLCLLIGGGGWWFGWLVVFFCLGSFFKKKKLEWNFSIVQGLDDVLLSFVWQITIISLGRRYTFAMSYWKTELNWGKSEIKITAKENKYVGVCRYFYFFYSPFPPHPHLPTPVSG